MQHKRMPQNTLESVVFTAITAFIMVYFMTLYNIVLATGSFTNGTFIVAAQSMWLEYVLIFLCAYFISSPAAKHFAFQVVRPGDRQIYVILAIQVFTVVCQVALASILGVWDGYGFTHQVLPDYIMTYCRNFIMALPLQLLIAGPLARAIFRCVFGRAEQQRMDAEDERRAREGFPRASTSARRSVPGPGCVSRYAEISIWGTSIGFWRVDLRLAQNLPGLL